MMLRDAFKMALRQTEGLMGSILTLMNLAVSTPDHTTVSRRAVGLAIMKSTSAPKGPLHVLIDSTGVEAFGAGQWLEAKHSVKSRRTWRKLHLAVDADSGMIVAQTPTDEHTDDASQVDPLLTQIEEEIEKIIADGVYDIAPTFQTVAQHGCDIEVVIPLRKTAFPGTSSCSPNQRDRQLEKINKEGWLAWQAASGYEKRVLYETNRAATLNRMLTAGQPNSVRHQTMAA